MSTSILIQYKTRLSLEKQFSGKKVIIIDASEPTLNERVATGLIRVFNNINQADLFFLGNTKRYYIMGDNAISLLSDFYNMNRGRVRIIGPILSSLHQTDKIILFTSGEIHDAPDWQHNSLARSILTFPTSADALFTKIGKKQNIEDITSLATTISQQPETVSINGPGFVPLWWDNTNYKLIADNGSFSLFANLPQLTNEFEMTMHYISSGTIIAEVRMPDGEKSSISINGIDFPITEIITEDNTGQLTKEEAYIFRSNCEGKSSSCPICEKKLTISQLKCGTVFNWHWVFESLGDVTNKWVILWIEGDTVKYTDYHDKVLKLGHNTIAIRKQDGIAVVYHFDEERAQWIPEHQIQPYYKLGGNRYVIFY